MNEYRFIVAISTALMLLISGCAASDSGQGGGTAAEIVEIPYDENSYSGAVFYDVDHDGVYRTNDIAIQGVQVTDGFNIMTTDRAGLFALPRDETQYVYITKPSGYELPLSHDSIPIFFQKVEDGKHPYLFHVTPSLEKNSFTACIMNDVHLEVIPGQGPHAPNQDPVETFHEFIDEFLALDPRPDFYLAVGDQSGVTPDDTSGLEYYVEACSRLHAPVYNVMGNPGHNDGDLDRIFFKNAYRSYVGPLYYSFDYGNYHFIVLDTNIISGDHGEELAFGLDQRQLEWFKRDLEYSKDKTLLLFYHEPIDNTENLLEYLIKVLSNKKPDVWIDKEKILEQIHAYPVAATFAGHTHTNGLYVEGGTIFVTNGAVSGAWWGPGFNKLMECLFPQYVDLGINAGPDGSPQGYRLMTTYPDLLATSFKAFREERSLRFSDPALTDIGTNKLSFLDQDTVNGYTFCIRRTGEDQSYSTGIPAWEPRKGIVPLVLNVFSIYPISGVSYRIDSGEWKETVHLGGLIWHSTIDTSLLEPGSHELMCRLVDQRGTYNCRITISIAP